jgi:hypothetical protein
MLLVVVLLPLSSPMYDGEFAHGQWWLWRPGGSGGSGGGSRSGGGGSGGGGGRQFIGESGRQRER